MTSTNRIAPPPDTQQTSWWTNGSKLICAGFGIESAIRAIGYFAGESRGAYAFNDFTINLGSAAYFSLATGNVLPGIARISAFTAVIFSSFYHRDSGAWYVTKALGIPTFYIMDNAIVPILERVASATMRVLTVIADFFGEKVLDNPVWPGVVILSVAALLYNDPLNIMPWSKESDR